MKGSAGIPALQLETLNKLIQKFDKAPEMFFSNMFPTQQYPSDAILWEIEYGSSGMTPFVAPGSVAPAIGLDGIGEGSAKAAYWKEKMFFDEVILNNLREPGTHQTYQTAERKIARGVRKLNYRCDRRREWMLAQMLINGSLSYTMKGGTKFSVSYGVPVTHLVTLAADRMWGTGANRNPTEDIFDGRTILSDDAGVTPNWAILNSELLKTLILDPGIQALLTKSAFGDGDLFKNPTVVIASLLGCGSLTVYDEKFEITGWLTANVTGGATVDVYVDDTSDFEVAGTARFIDMSEPNTWEDEKITAVDHTNGYITVANAPTLSFKASEDKVLMRKKFIDDDTFLMLSDMAEGEKIAEFMEAPYGNDRRWGKYGDKHDEWDPEGMWMRVQDKGLPVMYHPDTSYKIKVR